MLKLGVQRYLTPALSKAGHPQSVKKHGVYHFHAVMWLDKHLMYI